MNLVNSTLARASRQRSRLLEFFDEKRSRTGQRGEKLRKSSPKITRLSFVRDVSDNTTAANERKGK